MPIDQRRPAEIFKLPPGVTSLEDGGYHFHFLLRECDRDDIASLSWGSSKLTESKFGASSHAVKPQPTGINANGLRVSTHFYTSVIALCDEIDLGVRVGRSIPSLAAMRRALRDALGIGTGTSSPPHPSSLRGHIVAVRKYDDFDRALVLTAHGYSCSRRYQIIIPIQPGGVGVEVEGHVVRRADEPWVSDVDGGTGEALLLVPFTHSVWHEDMIDDSVAPVQVDSYTMARVEQEIIRFFRMPPSAPTDAVGPDVLHA